MTLKLPAALHSRLPAVALMLSLLLSFVAAIAVIGFNEVGYRRSAAAVGHVELYERSRMSLYTLLQSMLSAETGERGYLLSRDARYLDEYRQATQRIDHELPHARELFLLAQSSTAAFEPLAMLIGTKLAQMQRAIGSLQQPPGPDDGSKLLQADAGNGLMRDIRDHVSALVAQNSVEIDQRRGDIMRSLRSARIGIALTSLIALLAFYHSLWQARALAAANLQRKQELERERDLLDRLVQKRTARLAQLATHLQNVREDERAHLARELHDELGSLLTAAKLDVARLKSKLPAGSADLKLRLQHLTETLNSGIALKRRIIENLRPSSLSNLGLSASLAILTREFAEQSELAVHCEIAEVALDDMAQLTVYRLVQESLTNVGKYAEASAVTVRLCTRGDQVDVWVQDDGGGFNPEQTRAGAHGLEGMRHRVEAAGGELTVDSQLGHGTRVHAWLPTSSTLAR